MFKRTLYYLAFSNKKSSLPGLLRKIDDNKFRDEYTKEITNLTNQDVEDNKYIKMTPYASAELIRYLDCNLIDSLHLIISFETTDKMVYKYQYASDINLLQIFINYISNLAVIDIKEYIPTSIRDNYITLEREYRKLEIISAVNLYKNDYVEQVMELIDNYGINNIRKDFERYVDIEKPNLIKILTDEEFRDALYNVLKISIFGSRFKIYEISDNYINELFDLMKNLSENILSQKQLEVLCELDKVTHPWSSYPIDNVFESSIISNTLLIFPFKYTIDLDKLQKYNPLYNLIIVRGEESKNVYVVMYREKGILETDNPDITGFSKEEMDKIRRNLVS